MGVIRTEIRAEGVGHAVEAIISGDGERDGEFTIEVEVPEGSPALVVSATDDDSPRLSGGPVETRIGVLPPDGVKVNNEIIYTKDGVGIFVAERPAPGTWRVTVSHSPKASAHINVTAFAADFVGKLRKFGKRFGCRSCHVFIRPLVIAAIVSLVMQALPASAAAAILAAVKGTLGLTIGVSAIEKMIEILSEYASRSIEFIVDATCRILGLCG
jgi:hypothetical protein